MDTPSALSVEDVEFSALSANEWRVSDRRYARHDIEALLGFVARSRDEFFVTRMNHPVEAVRLGSLDQVAEFFVSVGQSTSETRSELAGA